jgi:hypothetical protein
MRLPCCLCLFVCSYIPPILARQRLDKNLPIVARQRLGRNIAAVTNTHATKLKLNSVALVRERAIPTERPPLVGEVVPDLRIEGIAWSLQRIPTVVNLGFLDRTRYFSLK